MTTIPRGRAIKEDVMVSSWAGGSIAYARALLVGHRLGSVVFGHSPLSRGVSGRSCSTRSSDAWTTFAPSHGRPSQPLPRIWRLHSSTGRPCVPSPRLYSRRSWARAGVTRLSMVVSLWRFKDHTLRHRVLGGAGLPVWVTRNAMAIGPEAHDHLWNKTWAKYHTRVAHIRAKPGPARERLRAYMMVASSILHLLAPWAPVAQDLRREFPCSPSPFVGLHPGCARTDRRGVVVAHRVSALGLGADSGQNRG